MIVYNGFVFSKEKGPIATKKLYLRQLQQNFLIAFLVKFRYLYSMFVMFKESTNLTEQNGTLLLPI